MEAVLFVLPDIPLSRASPQLTAFQRMNAVNCGLAREGNSAGNTEPQAKKTGLSTRAFLTELQPKWLTAPLAPGQSANAQTAGSAFTAATDLSVMEKSQ